MLVCLFERARYGYYFNFKKKKKDTALTRVTSRGPSYVMSLFLFLFFLVATSLSSFHAFLFDYSQKQLFIYLLGFYFS